MDETKELSENEEETHDSLLNSQHLQGTTEGFDCTSDFPDVDNTKENDGCATARPHYCGRSRKGRGFQERLHAHCTGNPIWRSEGMN